MIFYIIVIMNVLQTATIFGMKPVVALYASSIGSTPTQISMIVAAYALLPALLAVRIGKWTDKYGIRRMITFGNGLLVIALFFSALYPNFVTFVLQQTIVGIAFTCLMLSQQKCVGGLRGDVDRAIANYSLFGSLGSMIGPVLSTPLYEHFGYQICCLVNVLLMIIAFVTGFFMTKGDGEDNVQTTGGKKNPTGKDSIWSMMRHRDLRNAIIISGLVLSNRELFSAYFPLLAEKMGVSPTMIGILLAFSSFTMLIVRFCQTKLVRVFGRMKVLTWSLYISSLIYLLTPFSSWIIALFALTGILGGGLGLGQPLSISSVLEFSPPERRGEVLGVRITVNRVSQFAIPLIFGGIGGLAGVSAVFWGSGLVLGFFGYLTRPLRSDHNNISETQAYKP